MNFRNSLFLALFAICFQEIFSQKHWVFFTDKNGVSFNPYEYFDAKAIENRIRQNLPISDSTDFPVNEHYLSEIIAIADSLSCVTRWFNGAAIFATEQQLERIKKLSFVKKMVPIVCVAQVARAAEREVGQPYDTVLTDVRRALLIDQTKRMGIEEFEKQNIDGKGIRIAVFDAGFPTVDVNPAFEHLRSEKRILKTWDFVKNRESVYGFDAHGTNVLSCIAGKSGEQKIGLATAAEFLLARTEMAKREPFSEEEYWLAAAEWADKNGANIISSSLAYTYHRYFQKDMNGKKSLVARAANMAASKGILVVNAAGNDGNNRWKVIATPSDADSVLCVGGIDPYTDYHINFSSYGPTADKRVKPNVCAFGHVIVAGKSGLEASYGTSFATPLVAGFAACAWQKRRTLTNMELFREIEKSGDLYPYYDYAHGFGVPQASYFTEPSNGEPHPTFEFKDEKFSLKIVVKDKFPGKMDTTFENLEAAVRTEIAANTNYLYYHVENEGGYLEKYYVIKVEQPEVVELNKERLRKGQKIRAYYQGFCDTYVFR